MEPVILDKNVTSLSADTFQKPVKSVFRLGIFTLIAAPLTCGLLSLILAIITLSKASALKKMPLTEEQKKKLKSARLMGVLGLILSILLIVLSTAALIVTIAVGIFSGLVLLIVGSILVVIIVIGIVLFSLLSLIIPGVTTVVTGLVGILGSVMSVLLPVLAAAIGAALTDALAEFVYNFVISLVQSLLGGSVALFI